MGGFLWGVCWRCIFSIGERCGEGDYGDGDYEVVEWGLVRFGIELKN